jgi:copper oxidase (laccase) domain-containing protein
METLPLKALANDAVMTLRGSQKGFGFNLGLHVGDRVADVMERRTALERALSKPIFWVNQTHGTGVIEVGHQETLRKLGSITISGQVDPSADALVTAQPNCALAIMTADCLPVIFRTADHGCVGTIQFLRCVSCSQRRKLLRNLGSQLDPMLGRLEAT